ncbi:MAG: accessory factor UbiK family protein [Bdellovibrionales bacterium]
MSSQNLIEDLLTLASDALEHIAGARHELKAHAKSHVERLAGDLDLVNREEFDAAFAMLAKARMKQEDLEKRVFAIESILNLSSGKKTVKTKKTNLPSVKTKAGRRARK